MCQRKAVKHAQRWAAATLCIGTPLAHAATYVVTGNASAGGTLNATSQTIVSGKKAVFLVEVQDAGYLISSVSGCGGKLSSTTYTTGVITDNCTVTATFKAKVKYPLTISPAGTGSGSISGGGQFISGTAITLTATPDEGATFVGWSPSPCAPNFTMPTRTLACTAVFTRDASSGVAPKMVNITGGCFQMGSPEDEPGHGVYGDETLHDVCVEDFAIGQYEVTFDEYDAFVKATGRAVPADEGNGLSRGQRPVINVTWDDAVAYTEWLNSQTGESYRLPTEAEWEYAARAGTTTPYSWGATISHEYANYGTDVCCTPFVQGRDQWSRTAPVGAFPANPFGLYDMAGNVSEWTCSDWSDPYDGTEEACSVSGTEGNRAFRGGSWYDAANGLRAADRGNGPAMTRLVNVGFRVAKTLP